MFIKKSHICQDLLTQNLWMPFSNVLLKSCCVCVSSTTVVANKLIPVLRERNLGCAGSGRGGGVLQTGAVLHLRDILCSQSYWSFNSLWFNLAFW